MLFFAGDRVYISNLGDMKAVIMRKSKGVSSIMNILQTNNLFNSKSADKQGYKHSLLADIKKKNRVIQISEEHTLKSRKE